MTRPRFREEVILLNAKTTLDNARSKVDKLSDFGIDGEFLNDFEARIQTTEAQPRDIVLRFEQRDSTQAKNDVLANCHTWGREFRTRIELGFGGQSPELKSFPSTAFNKAAKSETRMMVVMEGLVDLAERYKDALAPFGHSEEIINQGKQLLADLRLKDKQQELKKAHKDSATRGRRKHFQEIYQKTNMINKVGRLVFKDDPSIQSLFESKWPL